MSAVIGAALLVSAHQTWSQVVLIYFFLMALFGLFLFFRHSEPSGQYLGALIIAEGVVVVQGVLGMLLVVQGYRPGNGLHLLYGLVALVSLPAAYLYTRGASVRGSSLIFGLVSLFLFGISIRAITTGGS
ncbi:MAG: hypothetical protein NVS2B16_19390 [Chloroflexota bacterium]